MAYITREDGERFIIPSYRDVLSAKKPAILRREVMLLCSSYGEYITLTRRNIDQYEVAFSPDPGFLLGETVWSYFKRPLDLIYCEAIPNTLEAILVIVKSGIVYLDGSFPIESIPDELVIFRTQQNNFDIYIYGDVPISETPVEGKFSFDDASVRSFTVLDKPVFPTLPTVKAFQLQLATNVLKTQGIGVFPLKQILAGFVVLGLIWMAFTYVTTHKKELPQVIIRAANPYQAYLDALASPDPTQEINWLSRNLVLLNTIPGWAPVKVDYSGGTLRAAVISKGARTNLLYDWAERNHAGVNIESTGFFVTISSYTLNRVEPTTISPLDSVLTTLIDSLSYVIPGNNMQIGTSTNRGKYSERTITINFDTITTSVLDLIGQQLKNMPVILQSASINMNDNGSLTGTITIKALGN
jgi:hypothetical protein